MKKKRFIAGLSFGLFMVVFVFMLQYVSGDGVRNDRLASYCKTACIAGFLSGVIFGSLFGRFPKN